MKTKNVYQCDVCNYKCEKNIRLIKHKNTKHTKVQLSNTEIDGTSVTGKHKFHCNQCNYSCQVKNSLKNMFYTTMKALTESLSWNVMNVTKLTKLKLNFKHTENHHSQSQENQEDPCECIEESVFDKCLDSWVQKLH